MPPKGLTVEQCRPLPITRVVYPDGHEGVMSFWRPTNEEIAMLINGASICVIFAGNQHPPMRLAIGAPT